MTIWRQNIRVKPLALLWHVALAIYIKITQGCVFMSCCHTSGFYFNRESQLRRTCGNMGIYCRWAICSLLNKLFNENMKKWSSLYVSINNNQIILTWKKRRPKKRCARLGMRTNRQGATLSAETVAGPSSIILRFLSGASPHLSVGSRGRSFHQFHGKILFHVSPAK